jgi:hypothetical protein
VAFSKESGDLLGSQYIVKVFLVNIGILQAHGITEKNFSVYITVQAQTKQIEDKKAVI